MHTRRTKLKVFSDSLNIWLETEGFGKFSETLSSSFGGNDGRNCAHAVPLTAVNSQVGYALLIGDVKIVLLP